MFLKFCYWNVHNVKDKLENDYVIKALSKVDVIWLSELRSDFDIHLPGYRSFRNSVRYPNHGGIILLIKDYLSDQINEIKFNNDDFIYFSFISIPDVAFCGVYSPPDDSKYFDMKVFAELNAMIMDSGNKYVVMIDMNAKIKDRERLLKEMNNLSYTPYQKSNNSNGDIISSICVDGDLILLNNLKFKDKCFSDQLTFRKKESWISQLDLCALSKELLDNVSLFEINQNLLLPSDHASILLAGAYAGCV